MYYKPNGNGASRVISGRGLAQVLRRLSPTERALLGADILDGRVIVSGLTAKSVAVLVGVSASYLSAAARATPGQRAEIRDGRPLILPTARALPAPIDWSRVDNPTLIEGARTIGADRMLAAAVAAECIDHPAA